MLSLNLSSAKMTEVFSCQGFRCNISNKKDRVDHISIHREDS